MDLRETIKARMQEKGITQTRLQTLTGILQHRISDYLAGKRDMTGESLEKILEALDLELRPARRTAKER